MSDISNYSPYAPNNQSLTEVLIDLKDTIASLPPAPLVGFDALCFENVVSGQPLYARASDGQVGRAGAGGTLEEATVVGFAQTSKFAGEHVRVLNYGILSTSGLDAGDIYFLSTSPGNISTVPPSAAGQYVTRVGEASTGASLIIRIDAPILLS
jgi:hypothetical protein